MAHQNYNLLFICHDNATYSPVAESLMTRWSDKQFSASSAGVVPAAGIHPFVIRILREKALPYPDHAPWPVERLRRGYDYIFLLDERIPDGWFEQEGLSCEQVVDWRLPAPPGNCRQDWEEMKRHYAVLEHRVRMLACTLFGSLEDSLLYQRMSEIARFRPAVH